MTGDTPQPAATPHPRRAKPWLWAELILLFVGGPTLLTLLPRALADGRLFPVLWLAAAGCLAYLLRDPGFERSRLWVGWASRPSFIHRTKKSGPMTGQTPIPPARQMLPTWPRTQYVLDQVGWLVFRWVVIGVLIVSAYGLFAGQTFGGLRIPVELFGLPRQRPALFFIIAAFYPWVSVYPQNVIYRAFFCRRYAPILGDGWAMILVNAALFSFGHIMFGNWIVLALTFAGGILFTRTYLRSRSLLLAVIEHALYGLICFAVGVGVYLLYGALP